MSNPIWPVTLPQAVLIGNTQAVEDYQQRTTMAVGPPKVRSRCTKVRKTYDAKLVMTSAQIDILESFYEQTLANGTEVFDWVDPRNQVTTTLRFVAFPTKTNLGPDVTPGDGSGLWEVGIQLETP